MLREIFARVERHKKVTFVWVHRGTRLCHAAVAVDRRAVDDIVAGIAELNLVVPGRQIVDHIQAVGCGHGIGHARVCITDRGRRRTHFNFPAGKQEGGFGRWGIDAIVVDITPHTAGETRRLLNQRCISGGVVSDIRGGFSAARHHRVIVECDR